MQRSRISWLKLQKEPSIGVPRKIYSENVQQIYRRTPMLKWYFRKIALEGTQTVWRKGPPYLCLTSIINWDLSLHCDRKQLRESSKSMRINITGNSRHINWTINWIIFNNPIFLLKSHLLYFIKDICNDNQYANID